MKCHFAMNLLGVLIQSDCHVFDRSIYHFIAGNLVMGSLGNSWSSILSTAHYVQLQHDERPHHDKWSRNALYCSISIAHGMGSILAGLIGAFFDVHSESNPFWIDTPFIVGVVLCAITMIAIHFYIKIPIINPLDVDCNLVEEERTKCSESLLSIPRNGGTAINGVSPRSSSSTEGVLKWHCPSTRSEQISSEESLLSSSSRNTISFDVLFASYCSISSIHGGMGWNGHFVGLFYVFYGFSWILLILYRFWKLKGGHSVTTSFSNSSVKMLRVNALSLTVIYGVIFPFCINSPTINHVEWTPISWLLLGFILAVLLGIISASTSYHIAQCLHDLLLNEVMADSVSVPPSPRSLHSPSAAPLTQSESMEQKMEHKVRGLLVTVSRSMLCFRILPPMVVQFSLVIGIHLNNTMISKHLHSKRQWYQIGNFVFYLLVFCSLSALLLLIAFDNARRERFGEEVDRQEMNRLIHELRKGINNKQNPMDSDIEQEDPHGLGFWISLNAKSMLSALPVSVQHDEVEADKSWCNEKEC